MGSMAHQTNSSTVRIRHGIRSPFCLLPPVSAPPQVAQNVAQTEPAKVACPGCAHVASEAELDLLTQVEDDEKRVHGR
jgi:hypothetical protein